MADNLPLNAGTGGKTVRTFQDSNTVDWPSAVICYVTALGTPDVLTVPLAAALTDAITNPTTITQGAANLGYNGTTWDRLRSTTANGLVVDVSRVQGTIAVDASATTQPISAAALPLPTGAATAVKQPALGIAGTASADVLSVQGIASMTALKVDGSGVTQPVSGTFWQSIQPVSGTVGISGTVTVASVGGTVEITNDAGNPIPVSGTVGASQSGTWTVQPGNTPNTVAWKVDGSAVTQPVSGTVTANQGGTWTVQPGNTANTTAWKVDGSAVTQPVSGTFWQATQPVSGTVAATQSGTWTVQPGNTANTTAWKVDGSAVTQPVSGTVSVNALPAGTALIGQVSASHETGTLYNGTTALTPKFAKIVASTSGATTIVAAVTSKKIRVLRWRISSNGIVNVKWQSHTTPTDLTGLSYLTQYASGSGGYCPVGIFETVAGEALDINLSAAIAVGGELTYVEI